MLMRFFYACFCIFVMTLSGARAEAGIKLIYEHIFHNDPDKNFISSTMISDDHIRIAAKGKHSDNLFIYYPKYKRYLQIDHKLKTYMELSEKDLFYLKNRRDKKISLERRRLEDLALRSSIALSKSNECTTVISSEIADEFKEIYRGIPGLKVCVKSSGIVTYKKGKKEQYINWTCKAYERYLNGQLVSDVCLMSASKRLVTKKDLQRFITYKEGMSKFLGNFHRYSSWFPQVRPYLNFSSQREESKEQERYKGLPVRSRGFAKGSIIVSKLLKEVIPVDALSIYRLPKDYKQIKIPWGEVKI